MKVKLKIDQKWLSVERSSMEKMKRDYETWATRTLEKAKAAEDLSRLREVFYELGDRWEWDQATGEWLSSGEPLDAVGLVLRLPGIEKGKERYAVYAVMAYSKGLTDQFDHLGDKERVIIERNLETNHFKCWSTTGHGMVDLFATDLGGYDSLIDILESCYLVAQPGDHALRLELPPADDEVLALAQFMWRLAAGHKTYRLKEFDLLTMEDLEEILDFDFNRYAAAVIELERKWSELSTGVAGIAQEAVLDRIPDHIERRNEETLRKVEGLLHELWFTPPWRQRSAIRAVYEDLKTEPTPTDLETVLLPYLEELQSALEDLVEKAEYLKWKSVIDKKEFARSGIFRGLDLSNLAKQAFAVALEDVLKEHTLAYIAYPERATMKDKILRKLFGVIVLPTRLLTSFKEALLGVVKKIGAKIRGSSSRDETATKETKSAT
ncbi:MAG: hypothetical protein GF309_04760 [Candidatus Lokiarchaeota archaeon]|nr:hypothetical protein [Candidatus Lokiarchaeota archaeon]